MKYYKDIIDVLDRHLPRFTILTVFLSSLFIFESWWVEIVNRFWVRPIMSKLDGREIFAAVVFGMLVTINYIFLFYRIERYRISRLLYSGLYIFIYLVAFLSGNWTYFSIIEGVKFSAWTNITFLPCILETVLALKCFILSRRDQKRCNNSHEKFEIEKPEYFTDSLRRKGAFDSISRVLSNSFYDAHSFTIGVMGAWGSGKTTLLKYLNYY